MKVKRWGGKATCSQYVRVNLVDFEHPFFGRVWHGVHILDHTSPLLTSAARKEIRQHGCWPSFWLESPSKIRKKLDFQHVVVTVSGLSNLSASTVHAYKRYKLEGKLSLNLSFLLLNVCAEKVDSTFSLFHISQM